MASAFSRIHKAYFRVSIIRFIFPASYFVQSRMQTLKDGVFHFYYEWLPAFILLFYFSGCSFVNCLSNFIVSYVAFISIYEIGYMGNDLYSVRFEAEPRYRLPEFHPKRYEVAVWVLVRLLVFVIISYRLNVLSEPRWLSFYAIVVISFFLHNMLRINELRSFTFICLAFTRFFAPVFLFLTPEQFKLIIPAVFLNYVVYRTFNYMNSKNMLRIPLEGIIKFKIYYYLIIGGVSILCTVLFSTLVPLVFNLYYLAFWVVYWFKQKYINN